MDLTEDHKNEIGMQLTHRIGELLEDKTLDLSQSSKLAEFILSRIDGLKTQIDLVAFLADLNKDWPYFESIQKLQQAPVQAEQDKQKAEKVSQLIKQNQVDEAIATAKDV